MIYKLEAYNTDSRYDNDIRYRKYTGSKKEAELFTKIPKIQFSDSGHGIVFHSQEHSGKRKSTIHILEFHVMEEMLRLRSKNG